MGPAVLQMRCCLIRATASQCVLFSQDDDFLAIARERHIPGVFCTGLIYGHQLAATIGKYVMDLELLCQVLATEDMANRVEYLPLDQSGPQTKMVR